MRLFGLVLLAGIVGCGSSSPTAPATTSTPVTQSAPEPAPPAPAPEPEPIPVPPTPPAPQSPTFDAEVGWAHWYGQPVFPGHFQLTINGQRIEAGAHGFDILVQSGDLLTAGTSNVETLTVDLAHKTWTYDGLAGQAYGGFYWVQLETDDVMSMRLRATRMTVDTGTPCRKAVRQAASYRSSGILTQTSVLGLLFFFSRPSIFRTILQSAA